VGIHCVLSCTSPETAVLDNQIRANLPVRLVGQVVDEGAAQAATGLSDTQAEYLLGQGDFLAVVGGEANHFQAAFIGDYDLHMCLDNLHRQQPLPLLARPAHLRPMLTQEIGSQDEPQSFQFDGWEITLAEPDDSAKFSRTGNDEEGRTTDLHEV
jgi:DNA segregation ATPase FtsK/SpoIIIE-like protein